MTTADKKAAFFHLIDSHRWLAASGCAWNQIKPGGLQEGKFDQYLPNITVMVRDCFLLHARSLIKFYRDRNNRPTDIVLSDFSVPSIVTSLDTCLEKYEKPIEIHLLHLPDWRDVDYGSHTRQRGTTVRPNWGSNVSVIAGKLIDECLKHASGNGANWQSPFTKFYIATAGRYRDKSSSWPTELCEKSDVEGYLKDLRL